MFKQSLFFVLFTGIFLLPFIYMKIFYLGADWNNFYKITDLNTIYSNPELLVNSPTKGFLRSAIGVFTGNTLDLFSDRTLFCLAPFAILGLIENWKSAYGRFTLLYLFSFIIFFGIIQQSTTTRYFLPNVILFVPFGVSFLIKTINSFFKNHKLIITGFFLFIVLIYARSITKYYQETIGKISNDNFNYTWYSDQQKGNIASTSAHRTNYFTSMPSVQLPQGMNSLELNQYINKFNLNYIHLEFFSITDKKQYSLFFDNKPIEDLVLRDYRLELMQNIDKGYGEIGYPKELVLIYRILEN